MSEMSQRYLELLQHLEGEQLLSQVVSTFNNDRQQPPVRKVTVRRSFSDPPAGGDRAQLINTLHAAMTSRGDKHTSHGDDVMRR